MKLITLNAWGGHIEKAFFEFIDKVHDVDIFCFQEIYKNADKTIATDGRKVDLNLFSHLKDCLPEHNGYFRPVVANAFGISLFIKNNIRVLEEGEEIIHDNPDYAGSGALHPRNMQWARLEYNNQQFYAINVHGLWNGYGKNDTKERIIQSQKIKKFINQIDEPFVLAGDFNLRPDTDSFSIIAEDLIDLVKEYDYHSTRTSYYTKDERYADYILTSKDVRVQHFEVMTDEVSDHAPLLLEFQI